MEPSNYLVDPLEVSRALELIRQPDQITELRVFGVGSGKPKLFGYFDQPTKLVESLDSVRAARAFYITLNPVSQELLDRAPNRTRRPAKGLSTKDSDIVSRTWLFIDADPVRPADTSATDTEHAAALEALPGDQGVSVLSWLA